MACSCYWTKALEKSTIAMGQAEKSLELLLGQCCFDLKRGWNRLQMLVYTCLKSLQDTDTQDGSEVCWWRNMGNRLVDMNLITSSSQIHYLIFNCKVGFTHKSIRWGIFLVPNRKNRVIGRMNPDGLLQQGGGFHPPPGPAWRDASVLREGLVEMWSSIVMLWHYIDSPGAPERTDGPSGYPNTKGSRDDVTVLKH